MKASRAWLVVCAALAIAAVTVAWRLTHAPIQGKAYPRASVDSPAPEPRPGSQRPARRTETREAPVDEQVAVASNAPPPASPSTLPQSRAGEQLTPMPDFFTDVPGNVERDSAPLGAADGARTFHALQARMAAESRDEIWASYAERELQDYLARQPFGSAFGSTDVECRQTMCRIMAVADQAVLAASPDADWAKMMSSDLQHESVWRSFSESVDTVVVNHRFPDQVGFVTLLVRADATSPTTH